MIKGIDTAATVTMDSAKKLYSLGYRFVGRYIVPETEMFKWKVLKADEAKIIRSAGLAILPIWETSGARAKGGYAAGTTDGKAAAERAKEFGIPDGTVIVFAVDYDAPKSDYQSIESYFRAAKWNIGTYKIGMYAPSAVIKELGNLVDFKWRTYAWNTGSVDADCYQTHYQDNISAKALQTKVDFAVDLDETKSIDLMWKPTSPEQDALKWAQSFKITDDPALALAFWRYHNTFRNGEDDLQRPSGLTTD